MYRFTGRKSTSPKALAIAQLLENSRLLRFGSSTFSFAFAKTLVHTNSRFFFSLQINNITSQSPQMPLPPCDNQRMNTTNIHDEIRPHGEVEKLAYERYIHALQMAERSRSLEITSQDAWTNEPNNHQLFVQMERIAKLAASYERRADLAMRELRKLQADRYSSMDVHNELYLMNDKAHVPVSLPVTEIRKQGRSAWQVAVQVLTNEPFCRYLLDRPETPEHDEETQAKWDAFYEWEAKQKAAAA
jgi:hypothetical protein